MTDTTADLWATAADTHPAWEAAEGSATTHRALVDQVEVWALLAERAGSTLGNDPWHDPEVALRWSARTADRLPRETTITSDEAALIVGLPFAVQAYWTRVAAEARTPEDEAELDRFVSGYSRLARRIEHLSDRRAAEAIRGWLLRRWLVRRPELYTADMMTELLGDPSAAISVHTLAGALRVLHRGPTGLAEDDLPARAPVLLYTLAAHRMALDPAALPDVVVDHLGIADPVDTAELRATLREASWVPRGRSIDLTASCRHQAVDVALTDHVQGLQAVLTAADAVADDPTGLLAGLPAHASVSGVEAALGEGGVRAYTGHGFRFRLADDRVQELLMGEQLYGDRALAIRELYQNALDACRYRQARLTYLERTGKPVHEPWAGTIEFRTGTDDDRPWIDCVDNGVGMGSRELVDVFSNAGIRFADLPEFVQEQADWAKVGIELYPNSRFGIGVLSYFMLADEITVTTCRMDRSGRPGRLLRVSIAGPGALARIQDLGPGTDAGTTVRLHLRHGDPATSPLELLRKILWISPFHVTASHEDERQVWLPDVLAPTARVGSVDPSTDDTTVPSPFQATDDPAVWWTSDTGAVLADGLWVSPINVPAVVNLTGAYAPQLTVDRRRAESYDRDRVVVLLRTQIPTLFGPGSRPLTGKWLRDLAAVEPDLADLVAAQAVAVDHRWKIGDLDVPARSVGCFPADWSLFTTSDDDNHSLPDHLAAWRLSVWIAAGLVPGIGQTPDLAAQAAQWPLAVPSDAVILSRDLDGVGPFLRPKELRTGPVLHAADRLGRTPQQVADRLTRLGFTVSPPPVGWDEAFTQDDRVILSKDVDARGPWLTGTIRPGPVYKAALALGDHAGHVAERMRELGLTVLDHDWVHDVEMDDLILLSKDLDGSTPWLKPGARRTVTQIVTLAVRLKTRPTAVAERLATFGFRVPAEGVPDIEADDTLELFLSKDLDKVAPWLTWEQASEPVRAFLIADKLSVSLEEAVAQMRARGLDVSPVDAVPHAKLLLSRDLDSVGPWLQPSVPVPLGHVLSAAQLLRVTPLQVGIWLTDLGHRLPYDLPETVTETDLLFSSRDLDGQKPWLDHGAQIAVPQIFATAKKTKMDPQEILGHYARLGYRVPDELPEQMRRRDLRLLSVDNDARRPWREPGAKLSFTDLIRASRGSSLKATARRARRLGLRARVPAGLPGRLDTDDLVFMSRDVDGAHPFLDRKTPVTSVHLVRCGIKTHRPLAEIAARLAVLGYTVPDGDWPSDINPQDLVLLSRDLDGKAPWLGTTMPVAMMLPRKRTFAEVRAQVGRAVALGMRLPEGFVVL